MNIRNLTDDEKIKWAIEQGGNLAVIAELAYHFKHSYQSLYTACIEYDSSVKDYEAKHEVKE